MNTNSKINMKYTEIEKKSWIRHLIMDSLWIIIVIVNYNYYKIK